MAEPETLVTDEQVAIVRRDRGGGLLVQSVNLGGRAEAVTALLLLGAIMVAEDNNIDWQRLTDGAAQR